jgi:sugar lactone lactonase YvrE
MLLIYTIEETMKKIHNLALISLFLLTACGGGGDGSSATTSGNSVLSGVTSFSGVAIDGYLSNAFVFLDLNNSGTFDAGEPNTYTDTKGNYTLQATQIQMSHSSVVIQAIAGKTVDLDSNTPVSKSYTLTAPNGVYSVVSPLTSMVVAQMKLNPSSTADQAQKDVANSFGISNPSDISSNYIATGNQPVHNIAAVSAFQLQQQSSSSPLSTQLTNALTQMNGISSYLPTVSKMSKTTAAISAANSLTNYHEVSGNVTTLELFTNSDTYPNFLAVDQNNNLYWDVVVLSAGTTDKIYTSLIGSGKFQSIPNSPSLNASGLVKDANGNIFLVDTGNCVIKKVTPDGTVSIIAGFETSSTCGSNLPNGTGTLVDDPGKGTAARFWHPTGIAMDPSGNGVLYVSDFNNQAIRKLTPNPAYDGYSVTTIAGSQPPQSSGGSRPCSSNQYQNPSTGSCQGYFNSTNGSNALFAGPSGIAVDIEGNVYVSETLNNTIRKLSPSTSGTTVTYSVSTLAGPPPPTSGITYIQNILSNSSGYADATGSGARFKTPISIAVDVKKIVYIVDAQNNRIRKVDTSGNVTTLAGSGSALTTDGNGVAASFNRPTNLVIDGNNKLYISEYNALRQIQ